MTNAEHCTSRKRDAHDLLNGPQLMRIKQEVVYNEKSQSTATRLQTNYSNVADGAYAEHEE